MVLSRGLVLVLVPFGDLVWVLALSRGLVPPRGMALVLSRGSILVLYRALVLVPSTGLALALVLPMALLHARLDPCCAKHRAPKPGIGVRLSPVTAPSRVREHRAASGCGGKEGSGGLQEEQGKGEQSRGGVEMGMGCRQGSPTASERSDVRIGGKGREKEVGGSICSQGEAWFSSALTPGPLRGQLVPGRAEPDRDVAWAGRVWARGRTRAANHPLHKEGNSLLLFHFLFQGSSCRSYSVTRSRCCGPPDVLPTQTTRGTDALWSSKPSASPR